MSNPLVGNSRSEETQNIGKRVLVLLATFNGIKWLPEQVDSILGQAGVSVRLLVSADMSTDGTVDWLQELANQDNRVTLLPHSRKFGSAAANFYRLILDADISACDYIAFSDQDDIWEQDKLSGHILIASQGGYDGVSSNVTAFWPNGISVKIEKSFSQRKLDFLFESAGPGCTYLMTPWLVGELRNVLSHPTSKAAQVALHDWLAYAVCRASGRRWYIDHVSSVQYRQHGSNEFGANHGLSAKFSRIMKMKGGWYRTEVIKIVNVCMNIDPCNPVYARLSSSLVSEGLFGRVRLLFVINQARRKMMDRIALAAAIVLFLF